MTDKINLSEQLELFKSQMKEVNESLCGFESQLEQEKAKIEKLRHSFFITIKLINGKMIESLDKSNFTISNLSKIINKKL